jgi:hypothetical protein
MSEPESTSAHDVQFYEDDDHLHDTVARYLGAGLEAGESLIVIATQSNTSAFCSRLRASGFDVERACTSGQLTLSDARDTLSQIMTGPIPDWGRFERSVGRLIERSRARSDGRAVRAYGEMVDLLWRDGQPEAALLLEELWNKLGMECH